MMYTVATMSTTTDLAAELPAAPASRAARPPAWVVAVVLVVAVGLVAAAAWATSEASSSRRIAAANAALRETVARSQTAAAAAQQTLGTLQDQLGRLQHAEGQMRAAAKGNAKQIAALNAKIKKLKAAQEAPAASASDTGSSVVVGTISPWVRVCYWKPNGGGYTYVCEMHHV
jgi:septal ring factor EnvC (AmiA/AmiB activator)